MTNASFDVAVVAGHGESVVRFRGSLMKEMRARDLSVIAIAPDLTESTRQWLRREGIAFEQLSLTRAGTNPVRDAMYCWELTRALRVHRPRVLLAYTVKPIVYGLPVARISGVERCYALVTGLGYAFLEGSDRWVGRLVRLLYRAALGGADGVFFQNPDDRALFREQRLLGPGVPSFVVNGSGIDLQSFVPTPVPSGPVRFLMIARLLRDKGVREYAAAARSLRARYSDATFSLAGYLDPNPSAIQRRELDEWIAEGAIDFMGELDDVRPALQASTVYVLPSYREGTPRTVLEAMATGRAIVTTDVPGCRETVVHGENGYLVAPRSETELAAAMEKFLEQPALAHQMGAASRRIAERKYDVRLVNEDMLQQMAL
jgi:glycosyltransferase involved in cell wall biosynthesis